MPGGGDGGGVGCTAGSIGTIGLAAAAATGALTVGAVDAAGADAGGVAATFGRRELTATATAATIATTPTVMSTARRLPRAGAVSGARQMLSTGSGFGAMNGAGLIGTA